MRIFGQRQRWREDTQEEVRDKSDAKGIRVAHQPRLRIGW